MSERTDSLLVVTRTIRSGHNQLPKVLLPGDTVFKFKDTTYGCCTFDEVPISLTGSYEYPFHGVPVTSVRPA